MANQKFEFTVEEKPLSSDKEKLAAREILELAKQHGGILPKDGKEEDIDHYTLKGAKAVYWGNETVDLQVEKEFTVGVKVFAFTVNGTLLESKAEKLVASDILKMARDAGAISPEGSYLLQPAGQQQTFQAGDWVDLTQFTKFLAILDSPTPVAKF